MCVRKMRESSRRMLIASTIAAAGGLYLLATSKRLRKYWQQSGGALGSALHLESGAATRLERMLAIIPTSEEERGESDKSSSQNRVHAIFDFDHTLTSADSMACHNVFLNKARLHGSLCHELEQLLAFTHPVMKDAPGIETWFNYFHGLLVQHELTEAEFEGLLDDALPEFKLRAGAKELLLRLDRLGMRITIVSAGIEQVVSAVLKRNGVHLSNVRILANRPHFSSANTTPANICVGFSPSSPINPRNKHLSHRHLRDWMDDSATNYLLFGDSLGDSKVVDQFRCESFKIGFFDSRKHWQSLEDFKRSYDLVLDHSTDFHWLCGMLQDHEDITATGRPK